MVGRYAAGGADRASPNLTSDLLLDGAVNADPVLHEIRHALSALVKRGVESVIDLNTMPFGPADLARLEEVLGEGEVTAKVAAAGESRVRESGIPGVWIVEHLKEGGQVASRFIEVTWIPGILKTDPADVEDGQIRLSRRLGQEERKTS